jgi:hypothetical protein
VSHPSAMDNLKKEARSMAGDAAATARAAAGDLRELFVPTPADNPEASDRQARLLDPVRFKHILIRLLQVLVLIEIVTALSRGSQGDGWGRLGFDLVLAGILYITWERIQALVKQKKETTRQQIERSPHDIKLWDALVFSLLWSDEIYSEIPTDRRRFVVIAYTLIAIGVVVAFMSEGSGLMPLIFAGVLVLGAANLIVWVVAVERGQREALQTELKLAHEVQEAMMPKAHPAIPGLDVAGISVPARDVGGDLFDYSNVGENGGQLAVSVIDVSGKGLQAALSSVFTVGALASEARQASSPATILTRLNASICKHARRGHFVAFVLIVFDLVHGRALFANAGQTKPLLWSGGTMRWLDAVGVHFPLGMKPDTVYEESVVGLKEGDVLFLLTDGFTDAMNVQQEMFGTERMEAFLRDEQLLALPAQQILDQAVASIRTFVGAASQHDDMTMVVIKVEHAG